MEDLILLRLDTNSWKSPPNKSFGELSKLFKLNLPIEIWLGTLLMKVSKAESAVKLFSYSFWRGTRVSIGTNGK
jgi:hypothetical protein